MKHDWEDIKKGGIEDMGNYGHRRCRNCGKEQTKESIHVWMRVVGYQWYPLAGRCKPKEAT